MTVAPRPRPDVSRTQVLSPSTAETLMSCPARFAFSADPRFRPLIGGGLPAALGNVVHTVAERVDERAARDAGDDVDSLLNELWDAAVTSEVGNLAAEERLAPVPDPPMWPNYEVTRARVLGRLRRQLLREPTGEGTGRAPARREAFLSAPDMRFRGRVDRVESGQDGSVTIVDLKSSQEYGDEITERHRRQLLVYAALWHAENGEWPRRAAIELNSGERRWMEIDAAEAQETVASFLRLLDEFNERAEDGEDMTKWAVPRPDNCMYCPFRVACQPFFDALSPEWDWWLVSGLGQILSVTHQNLTSVTLAIEATNLERGEDSPPVRLTGLPQSMDLEPGTRFAFANADRARARSDDLRVIFPTAALSWGEPG